jgi:hypothetical protein
MISSIFSLAAAMTTLVRKPCPAWKGDAVVNQEFRAISSTDYKGHYCE